MDSLNSDKVIARSADRFTRSEIERQIDETKKMGAAELVLIAHSIRPLESANGSSGSEAQIIPSLYAPGSSKSDGSSRFLVLSLDQIGP